MLGSSDPDLIMREHVQVSKGSFFIFFIFLHSCRKQKREPHLSEYGMAYCCFEVIQKTPDRADDVLIANNETSDLWQA